MTVLQRILAFFFVLTATVGIGTLLLISDNVDPITALTSIIAFISSAGFGFGAGGPAYSFAFLTTFGKIVSIVVMLLGRLEFFVLLTLFMPSFWRHR
jgi:trk system potassium uptake protein TrkH